METNPMATNLYSNMGSGMLGLEMSLQHHHQLPPQSHHHQQQHRMQQQHPPPPPQQPMVGFSLHDGGADQVHHPQTIQMCPKPSYPLGNKPNNQTLILSDDDEHGAGTENSGDCDGKRKTTPSSPWQRMKWTDNMVRVLIMVVYYTGDDFGSEGPDPNGKKKGPGVLLKKGKWKSVSKAMMEKGFFVSPQQCEDKFNDLNKRYKRVNDILGKGISCKVVENQSLLDSMDHLSAKTKEEVKKLLNSKHLFFREMCAYHNSCGHGGGDGGGAPENGRQICQPSSSNLGTRKRANSYDDDNESDDDEDGEDGEGDHADDEATVDERSPGKRLHGGEAVQRLGEEMARVVEDESRSAAEKRGWIKMRQLHVEEEQVEYQRQAVELEKERLKWVKYSSNKERELEMDRLRNERMILENRRMSLLIRQKELELLQHMQ